MLRPAGGPSEATPYERVLESATTRVAHWAEIGPFYTDERNGAPKTSQSRGTEAILNALILAQHDARRGTLSDRTLHAFDNLWALQQTSGAAAGAWPWLHFNLAPWESDEGPYHGAALAAVAVGTRAGWLRRPPRHPGQRRTARRLPPGTARQPATLQSHHGAVGLRGAAGSIGRRAAAGDRRRDRRPAAGGRGLEPVVAGEPGRGGTRRPSTHRVTATPPDWSRSRCSKPACHGITKRLRAASPGSSGTRTPTDHGPPRRSTGTTIRRRTAVASCATPRPRTPCWP